MTLQMNGHKPELTLPATAPSAMNAPIARFMENLNIFNTRDTLALFLELITANRDAMRQKIQELQASLDEADNLALFFEDLLTRPSISFNELFQALNSVQTLGATQAQAPGATSQVEPVATEREAQPVKPVTEEIAATAQDEEDDSQAAALAKLQARQGELPAKYSGLYPAGPQYRPGIRPANTQAGQDEEWESDGEGEDINQPRRYENLKDVEGYYFRVYDQERPPGKADADWKSMAEKTDKVRLENAVFARVYKSSAAGLTCQPGNHPIDKNHFYIKEFSTAKDAKGRGMKSNKKVYACLRHYKIPFEVRTPEGKTYNPSTMPLQKGYF